MSDRWEEKAREWLDANRDLLDAGAPAYAALAAKFQEIADEARREEAAKRADLIRTGMALRGTHGEKCRYDSKDECPAVQAWDEEVKHG